MVKSVQHVTLFGIDTLFIVINCRYIAILHPFLYDRAMTKFKVILMIAATWILSGLLSFLPIFKGWYATPDHLAELRSNGRMCVFKVSQPYAFVSSSVSFWIPSTVMVVLYQRILSTARKQERHIKSLMRPPLPHSDDLSEPMLNSNSSATQPIMTKESSSENWSEEAQTPEGLESIDYNDNLHLNQRQNGNENITLAPIQNGNKLSVQKDVKQMKKMRKEHRAAKTLGIIMGCFLACMSPIFIWYTITFGICPEKCSLEGPRKKYQWIVTLVFWIGYFNSCMNPIIYGFFNRDFKIAFKRLYRSCRKISTDETSRKQSMLSETGFTPPTTRRYKQ